MPATSSRRPPAEPGRAAASAPADQDAGDAGELPGAVQLGGQPGAGGPVGQVDLDLADPQAPAEQVD